MGLGTMTVLHDANVEGSDPILNGVYAGGFESLVEATRQVIMSALLPLHALGAVFHAAVLLCKPFFCWIHRAVVRGLGRFFRKDLS